MPCPRWKAECGSFDVPSQYQSVSPIWPKFIKLPTSFIMTLTLQIGLMSSRPSYCFDNRSQDPWASSFWSIMVVLADKEKFKLLITCHIASKSDSDAKLLFLLPTHLCRCQSMVGRCIGKETCLIQIESVPLAELLHDALHMVPLLFHILHVYRPHISMLMDLPNFISVPQSDSVHWGPEKCCMFCRMKQSIHHPLISLHLGIKLLLIASLLFT